MKVNLNQLYTFYMVVKEKGTRAAAKKLYVSPSAVSMQIKRLEEWLGFPLFINNSARLTLSDQAEKLMPLLESLFMQAKLVDQTIESMMNKREKSLRIGISVTPAEYYLPALLSILSKKEPNLEIDISVNMQDESMKKLRNREIDVAILGEKLSDDFYFQKFVTSEVVFAVCSKNNTYTNKEVHIKELEESPLLFQARDSGFAKKLWKYLEKHKVKPSKFMENISNTVAKNIIPGSQYGAFFDKVAIKKELENNTLQIVNIAEQAPSFALYFCFLKESFEQGEVKHFIDALPTKEEYELALKSHLHY